MSMMNTNLNFDQAYPQPMNTQIPARRARTVINPNARGYRGGFPVPQIPGHDSTSHLLPHTRGFAGITNAATIQQPTAVANSLSGSAHPTPSLSEQMATHQLMNGGLVFQRAPSAQGPGIFVPGSLGASPLNTFPVPPSVASPMVALNQTPNHFYPQMYSQSLMPATSSTWTQQIPVMAPSNSVVTPNQINPVQPTELESILVPRMAPNSNPPSTGPKEGLFFNQTATGLGTLLSDCINHVRDLTFLFDRGAEAIPHSWLSHLDSTPEPDFMNVELTWPGYPELRHPLKIRIRSEKMANMTIAKRHVASQIAQGFCSMYKCIQDNESKLRAGEPVEKMYLPTDGRWELGPNWITLEKIKLVSLEWAHGNTFQAQMAVVA